MKQAVQQGRSEHGVVVEDASPLLIDAVGGDQGGTKLAALGVALRRPQGATSLQWMLATGWQPHSVRGAISGLLRKRLGLNVVLMRNAAGERVYRIG